MQRHKRGSWKFLEKLVAAIHRVELAGTEVRWNDKINGQQFDVTIRFTRGPYMYLTVIECKDHAKPVKKEVVAALATKASDVNASKAILVSVSGFQSGCLDLAERHGIELFALREINELSEDLLAEGLIPALNFWNFALHLNGRSEPVILPEAKNILPFLARKTQIQSGSRSLSLEALIDGLHDELFTRASQKEDKHRIDFPPGTTVTIPGILSGNTLERVTLSLSAVTFSYKLVSARKMKEPGLDPYLLRRSYRYTNAVTGGRRDIPARGLPIGFDTVIEAGRFYEDPDSGFSYYCGRVEGNLLTMTVIESYQHGRLISVDFTALRQNARNYVEVTDGAEITRLTAMLRSLRKDR